MAQMVLLPKGTPSPNLVLGGVERSEKFLQVRGPAWRPAAGSSPMRLVAQDALAFVEGGDDGPATPQGCLPKGCSLRDGGPSRPCPTAAASWALEVQRGAAAANDNRTAQPEMRFRVGIDLGEVLPEGTDLHGDS